MMDYNTLANIAYCGGFVDSLRGLLYYSHGVPAVAALFVSLVVLLQNRSNRLSRLLLFIALAFAGWCIANIIVWLQYASSSTVMFAWTMIQPLAVALFFLTYAFVYLFLEDKQVPAPLALLAFILYAPVLIFAPTTFNLPYFDLQECVAIETNLYVYYTLLVELTLAVLALFHPIFRLIRPKQQHVGSRPLTWLLLIGVASFLYAMLVASYITTVTLNYTVELYGLFGMLLFVGILSYMIVKYQAFNVRVLAVQALTATLVLLVGAQFLFVRNPINRALTMITFVFISVFSILLVRSVKREIAFREQLAQANAGQERFIHFLSHEVKGFLTVARNGFASIAEGDFGAVPEPLTKMCQNALERVNSGVITVEGILKSANLKSGKVTFKYAPFDMCAAIRKRVDAAKSLLAERGLTIETNLPDGDYIVVGDAEHLTDHVLRNLIENAIYYTPSGSVRVSLTRTNTTVLFSVRDTGVGISSEDKRKLFTEGGHGAESSKYNAHSTGHGLFIAKNIVVAHGGKIWAESAGPGKGTTFYVELPVNPPAQK